MMMTKMIRDIDNEHRGSSQCVHDDLASIRYYHQNSCPLTRNHRKLTTTYPFNGLFSGQLGKPAPERQTILDFTEARDDGVAVKLDHMQIICTSLQTDNHASTYTSPLSFFTGQMPFPPPNQQRQSIEGMQINLIS